MKGNEGECICWKAACFMDCEPCQGHEPEECVKRTVK